MTRPRKSTAGSTVRATVEELPAGIAACRSPAHLQPCSGWLAGPLGVSSERLGPGQPGQVGRRAVGDSGCEQGLIRTSTAAATSSSPPCGSRARRRCRRRWRWSGGRRSWPAGRALRPRRAGAAQLVFVTGEPGIGKKTLVEAFTDEVEGRRDELVDSGQCSSNGAGPNRTCGLRRAGAALPGRRIGAGPAVPPGSDLAGSAAGLVEEDDRAELERRALGGTTERRLREAAAVLEAVAADRPLVAVPGGLH